MNLTGRKMQMAIRIKLIREYLQLNQVNQNGSPDLHGFRDYFNVKYTGIYTEGGSLAISYNGFSYRRPF